MKGAYHDPVDHSRTTQPHAGESMIDTLWFPGLVLIGIGIVGLAGIVAAAAYGHPEWVLPLALVSGAVVTAGSASLLWSIAGSTASSGRGWPSIPSAAHTETPFSTAHRNFSKPRVLAIVG